MYVQYVKRGSAVLVYGAYVHTIVHTVHPATSLVVFLG